MSEANPGRPGAQPVPEPHHDPDEIRDLPRAPVVAAWRLAAFAIVVVAGLGALFVMRVRPLRRERQALAVEMVRASAARLRVEGVKPRTADGGRLLSFPASVQPLEETVLYPRATGYVKRWLADLGDRVKAGQLLAEIDTPELDQEIAQARASQRASEAAVAQTRASLQLAKVTLARFKDLLSKELVTHQEFDERTGQAGVAEANLQAASAQVAVQKANLGRLLELRSFARLTAPFDATITGRNVVRGALVTPGSAPGAWFYRLAATDPLRVMIQVPQAFVPGLAVGGQAEVSIREYPGRVFKGTVARTAGALDAVSRTLTVEVRLPNPEGTLIPGTFAQVALPFTGSQKVLLVPATAMINGADGLRLAVVDGQGRVRLRKVLVDRDDGRDVAIVGGLEAGERVVNNPPAELVEGAEVEVVTSR